VPALSWYGEVPLRGIHIIFIIIDIGRVNPSQRGAIQGKGKAGLHRALCKNCPQG